MIEVYERQLAELRLQVHNLELRYESANRDRNARAEERVLICEQLQKLGYSLDINGNVYRLEGNQNAVS